MGTHDGLELFPVILIGVAAIAAIFLILSPDIHVRPEQGSLVGAAYADISEVPAQFAPPWNVFTDETFLTLDVVPDGDYVNITVNAEHPDMIFYQTFYASRNATNPWKTYAFPQETIGDSSWIGGEARKTIRLPLSELDAENYVIVYGCVLENQQWWCGCRSNLESNCSNKWSLQSYDLTVPGQTYSCTGSVPLHATLCSGDDTGLNENTARTLVTSCTTSKKCEYTCDGPAYVSNGTACNLDPAVCNPPTCNGKTLGALFCGTNTSRIYSCDTLTTGCTILNETRICGSGQSCTASATGAICQATTCSPLNVSTACTNPPSSYDDECYTATCTSGSCSYDATNEGGDCTTSSGETGTCQSGACVTQQQCSDECTTVGEKQCVDDAGVCPDVSVTHCPGVQTCTQMSDCKEWQTTMTCNSSQTCDASTKQCTSCGDGIKQEGEECDDGVNNGQCPAECSSSCTLNNCNSADGDTSESACQVASDQTTTPAANPPDQEAFDYSKAWLDPWPTGAEGTGNCCGDDANEWLLYDEGNDAIKSCCNAYTDCVDSSGACKTHNALYGGKFCYYDWWYNCNSGTRCMAHTDPSLDPTPTKDCYYQNGAYAWSDYDNPPAENCTDGKDNDCDGDVDGADADCSVDFFVNKIMTEAFGNSFSSSFCAEPATSLLDGVTLEADVLFSSEGKNGQGTYTFSPGSANGDLYSLADCHGATRQESVGGFDNAPDYITVRITIDKNNQVPEVNENNNEKTVVISLNNAVNSLCGGHGEWPCDAQNHGKWCHGRDATTCGVTCDAGYTFCPDTNGCWVSC